MNKPKIIFSVVALFLVCLLNSTTSFAQAPTNQQTQPSYEVVLQVLTASNNAGDKSNAVPQTLSNAVKKLKTNYTFSNYRLSLTYLQRVANTGNLEFKGVSNEPNQDVYVPIFSDWTIGQLMNLPDAKGQNSISIQNFRFGQRVPVKTTSNTVNYEYAGLTMGRLNLLVNTPTVIGNLSTSKPDEVMFLILTVKPTQE
jgi:hypothetical protein